jgi:phosphoribosyl 1,2-cyclic phosphodiesterase
MQVKLLGVRGSIPVPDASAARYGGNTPCAALTLSDGSRVVLDAGSGIRALGATLAGTSEPIHILLSHLHLDHIQGLLFFKPLFDPGREITIWGPPAGDGPLRDRLSRYLSAPLSPIEMRELPARISYRTCPPGTWRLGSASVAAGLVNHRGPTFGYRVSEGSAALCYLPDHEPALGQSLDTSETEWISGFALAHHAALLIHDGQYTDREYRAHVGWGHSAISDALQFARRAEARRVILFHHDPAHTDDALDALGDEAKAAWTALGGGEHEVEMASEQLELTVDR